MKCRGCKKEFEKDKYVKGLWKKFLADDKDPWCSECLESMENKMMGTKYLTRSIYNKIGNK